MPFFKTKVIKNENRQAASRDLGAHALQLYLYLASNANNYTLALSPTAVRQAIGMARSTYHDQFHKLVDKGYLVPSHGNTYEFYETPQPATQPRNVASDAGLNFEEDPSRDNGGVSVGQAILAENIETNNRTDAPNNVEINISADEECEAIQEPQVREVRIARPVAEGKKRPAHTSTPPKGEFVF